LLSASRSDSVEFESRVPEERGPKEAAGSLQAAGSLHFETRECLSVLGAENWTGGGAVTARIQGGGVAQTHTIDVSSSLNPSMTFAALPVATGYIVTLTVGECAGSHRFDIVANQKTLVAVNIVCPGPVGAGGATAVARGSPAANKARFRSKYRSPA
jgi:hypothetical protein